MDLLHCRRHAMLMFPDWPHNYCYWETIIWCQNTWNRGLTIWIGDESITVSIRTNIFSVFKSIRYGYITYHDFEWRPEAKERCVDAIGEVLLTAKVWVSINWSPTRRIGHKLHLCDGSRSHYWTSWRFGWSSYASNLRDWPHARHQRNGIVFQM